VYIRLTQDFFKINKYEEHMLTIDQERRELLILKKNIAQMERAIEEMKQYAEQLEEKLFDEFDGWRCV